MFTYYLTTCHLQGVLYVRSELVVVQCQVDRVLVGQDGTVPQDRDDEHVGLGGGVEEHPQLVAEGAVVVAADHETVAVVDRRQVALDVEPETLEQVYRTVMLIIGCSIKISSVSGYGELHDESVRYLLVPYMQDPQGIYHTFTRELY